MTPFQRELLLRFKGREHPFVAARLANYEEHERWRSGELAAFEELAREGLLWVRSPKNCKRHGKCHKLPFAVIGVLTDKGEETLAELRGKEAL